MARPSDKPPPSLRSAFRPPPVDVQGRTADNAKLVRDGGTKLPALLVVLENGQPALRVLPLYGTLFVGRAPDVDVQIVDGEASRKHATIARSDRGFAVTDLQSQNGTFVDGVRLEAGGTFDGAARVVRVGGTIAVLLDEVAPFGEVRRDGDRIYGAAMQAAMTQASLAARMERPLLILGPTGAGKEGIARHYHDSGRFARGPFHAVNCATFSETRAESELFGWKKGAFSGAIADGPGAFVAAERGTLFLDELGDLALEVQPKLLRALETKEIFAVGSTSARKIDVALCAATNADIHARADRGEFRPELLARLEGGIVTLPPLRERPDEIPWLAARAFLIACDELRRAGVDVCVTGIDATLVEACLLRNWETNIRGLTSAVVAATIKAQTTGAKMVSGDHLPQARATGRPAAMSLSQAAAAAVAAAGGSQPTVERKAAGRAELERKKAAVLAAYAKGWDVEEIARMTGVSRTRVYDYLKEAREKGGLGE